MLEKMPKEKQDMLLDMMKAAVGHNKKWLSAIGLTIIFFFFNYIFYVLYQFFSFSSVVNTPNFNISHNVLSSTFSIVASPSSLIIQKYQNAENEYPLNVRNAIAPLDAMAFSFIYYPKVPGSIFINCVSFTFPAAWSSLVGTEPIDMTDNASVHAITTLAIIFFIVTIPHFKISKIFM